MKKRDFNDIEQSIKEIRCTTTLQADDKILSGCFAQLGGDLQRPSMLKLIIRSKIFWMAAATLIIAAVMIGVMLLLPAPVEKPLKGTAVQIRTETAPEQVADKPKIEQKSRTEVLAEDVKTNLNTELKQVIDMFSANDIGGLTAMLSDQNREIKLAAAVYLAKIGDANSAQMLAKLSAGSDDKDISSMFAVSASLILKRLEVRKESEIAGEKVSQVVRGATLSGYISDARTALPVTGADVRLSNDANWTVKSDANGFYLFEKIERPGDYTVTVLLQQYFEKNTKIHVTEEDVSGRLPLVADFQLDKACMIEFSVVDEANEPFVGAKIIVTSPSESNEIRIRLEKETDKKGQLVLGGLERGTYDIIVLERIPNVNDVNDIGLFFAPQYISARLEDPNRCERCKVVMLRGFEVEGFTRFADGSPASNMKIVVQPVWWHLPFDFQVRKTDFEGRFMLDNITEDIYRIKVAGPTDSNDILTMEAALPGDEQYLIITLPVDSNTPAGHFDSNDAAVW
jgi:hypothetical protein